MTLATRRGLRGRHAKLLPLEQLEVRTLLSASGSPLDDLVLEENPIPQAIVAAPIAANWIPQGPSPTQQGQVENITPNDEVVGAIHALAAHPTNANILYLGGTNGGIWKSTNATASSPTWVPQTDDMESQSIGALEFDLFDSNTLVAGIGRFSSFSRNGGNLTGMLRTTDGGNTWVNPGSVGLTGVNVSGIVANGSNIVAVGNGFGGGGGIHRSTDGGATFTTITNGLPGSFIQVFDLVTDPTDSQRLYASVGSDGIYRSDDFGVSWTQITSGDATLDPIFKMPTNNNAEMAVAGNGRLYVMVMLNGQASYIGYSDDPTAVAPVWTAMDLPQTPESDGETEGLNPREKPGGQGGIHSSIRVDPFNPTIIYVGGDRQDGPFPNYLGADDFTGRLFRGDTKVDPTGDVPSPQWEHLTHSSAIEDIPGGGTASGSAPHADSREMVFNANGDLIEADDGGIYRRTSPRTNTGDWFSIIGNLQTTEFHSIAYDTVNNAIIGGAQDTGTPVQLSEGSLVWTSVSTADGGDVAVDDSSTPGFSTHYSSSQNLGGFRRVVFDANGNVVGGAQIALQEQSANQLVPVFVTPVTLNEVFPTRLIIGGQNATWESFDQGDTISIVGAGIPVNSGNGNPIAYGGYLGDVPNPYVLYVGSNSNVFIRTSAQGALLPAINYPGSYVNDIELDDSDWRKAYVTDSNDKIYYTADAGATWDDITGGLDAEANGFQTLEFVPGMFDDAVVVGTNLGVYAMRTSTPGTWSALGDLPTVRVWDMDYDASDDVLIVGTLGRGAWKLNAVSTVINPFDLPDLVGDHFEVIPSDVVIGEAIEVDYRIRNADVQDSSSFRVEFFLSRDANITSSDFFLGQQNIAGLSGGATTALAPKSLQLPSPANTFWQGDGAYYIGMIIDRFDLVTESNESNNSNFGSGLDFDSFVATVPDVAPDLLGTSFNVVQEPLTGGNAFDVNFTVLNDSTVDAGAFTVGFYLSRNDRITTTDEFLDSFSINDLSSGSSVTNSINLQLPAGEFSYGNLNNEYFIGMIIDFEDVVDELSENNNSNLGELVDRDKTIITLPPVINAPEQPDTIGAFNPTTHTYFLRNSNDSGNADVAPFNLLDGAGAIPISGDWNGDGIDTVGLYSPNATEFRLINENDDDDVVEVIFKFGVPGWLPIAGDWNGDGVDSVGLYDPVTSEFHLRASNAAGSAPVTSFNFGMPGWKPVVGDWDGNGTETVGLYNPATASFFLRNSHDTGVADMPAFNYGLPNWIPLAGDWNSDGIDTIGVHNALTATYFLRNANNSGVADIPAFNYGIPNWIPLAGKWSNVVQPILATGGEAVGATSVPSLTNSDVQSVLGEAVGKWAAAGIDANMAALLSSSEIRIADLPGAMLGQAIGNRIYLDINAAGYGWFVDSTPEDDDEYDLLANQQLSAKGGDAAAGVDLLSVLTHELGHVLGLDDHDDDHDDIMFESIAEGQRRTPSAAVVDELLSN